MALCAVLALPLPRARAQIEWSEIAGVVALPGGGISAQARVELHDVLGGGRRADADRRRGPLLHPRDPPRGLLAEGREQRIAHRVPTGDPARAPDRAQADPAGARLGNRGGQGGGGAARRADRLRRGLVAPPGRPSREPRPARHPGEDGRVASGGQRPRAPPRRGRRVPVRHRRRAGLRAPRPPLRPFPDAASIASIQVLSGYVPPRYGLRSAGVAELRSSSRARPPLGRRRRRRGGQRGNGLGLMAFSEAPSGHRPAPSSPARASGPIGSWIRSTPRTSTTTGNRGPPRRRRAGARGPATP